MRKEHYFNKLLSAGAGLIFLLFISISLVSAQDIPQVEINKKQPITIKVTLNDYANKSIVGVRVNLQERGNEGYSFIPILNPKANNIKPGITDQNGTVFFQFIPSEPGLITVIATAEKVTKKPPLLVLLLRKTWNTFIKTEKLKTEKLDLLGSIEYKFLII